MQTVVSRKQSCMQDPELWPTDTNVKLINRQQTPVPASPENLLFCSRSSHPQTNSLPGPEFIQKELGKNNLTVKSLLLKF